MKAEEGYMEYNLTRSEYFAAGIYGLQQNKDFLGTF
jgi:hypothetical protein